MQWLINTTYCQDIDVQQISYSDFMENCKNNNSTAFIYSYGKPSPRPDLEEEYGPRYKTIDADALKGFLKTNRVDFDNLLKKGLKVYIESPELSTAYNQITALPFPSTTGVDVSYPPFNRMVKYSNKTLTSNVNMSRVIIHDCDPSAPSKWAHFLYDNKYAVWSKTECSDNAKWSRRVMDSLDYFC